MICRTNGAGWPFLPPLISILSQNIIVDFAAYTSYTLDLGSTDDNKMLAPCKGWYVGVDFTFLLPKASTD